MDPSMHAVAFICLQLGTGGGLLPLVWEEARSSCTTLEAISGL